MDPHGALILDLDGTIVIGDDPVRVYLAAAAERLATSDPGAAAELRDVVEAYLEGERAVDAPDGYQAVARTGLRLGLSPSDLDAAYASVLRTEEAIELVAPPELAPLLTDLRPGIRIVVASNGPPAWVDRVLVAVGVAELVDERHGSLGKPAGLERFAGELLERYGWKNAPQRLLGVGDIWMNDLAPLAALGAGTALIDRWGRSGGTPQHRGAVLAELAPAIRRWAADVNPV